MKSDELFITTGLFEPSLEDPFTSETDDNETLDGIIPHQVESIWDAICLNAFDSEALIGIQRHRIATDGAGITTLVGFHRCPLSCAYVLILNVMLRMVFLVGLLLKHYLMNCSRMIYISDLLEVVLPLVVESPYCNLSL